MLHYQKINNDPESLGLIGTYKNYNAKYSERINFIKQQLATYKESWIQEKVKEYLDEFS